MISTNVGKMLLFSACRGNKIRPIIDFKYYHIYYIKTDTDILTIGT